MKLFLLLLFCLALTEAIELPVLYAFGFRGADMAIGALANVLTNPAVVFIHYLLTNLTSLPQWAVLLPLEALAVLIEAHVFISAAGRKHGFTESFAANAASFLMGLAITSLIF